MTTPTKQPSGKPSGKKVEVARGLGPPPVRIALVAAALIYFVMLIKHPDPRGWIKQLAYFSECTGLFTTADTAATEFSPRGLGVRSQGVGAARSAAVLSDARR